jgi:Putative prokaryotic signal transducing protein
MGEEQADERDWQIARILESSEEAVLVAGFLNSSGIPAEVESLHVEELPVNLGGLGEVRVLVPADRLDEARALLDASEAAGYAGDDGDDGDGGDGAEPDNEDPAE